VLPEDFHKMRWVPVPRWDVVRHSTLRRGSGEQCSAVKVAALGQREGFVDKMSEGAMPTLV